MWFDSDDDSGDDGYGDPFAGLFGFGMFGGGRRRVRTSIKFLCFRRFSIIFRPAVRAPNLERLAMPKILNSVFVF